MDLAALVLWVMTALGGFAMLGIWLKHGGMRQQDHAGPHIRPPLILSHFGLAAGGLVLWVAYLATDSGTLAWVSSALLVVVALLGFAMLAVWLQRRRDRVATPASATAATPAEQRFPVPVVVAHGLFAATTLVLAFLAAAAR